MKEMGRGWGGSATIFLKKSCKCSSSVAFLAKNAPIVVAQALHTLECHAPLALRTL